MESLIVAVSSVSATLLAVWASIIYPRKREKAKLKAIEDKKQADRNAFLDGVAPIDGVTEGAQDAARRLQGVEHGLTSVKDELSSVKSGQSLLEQRMDEANGTGKRTEIMVARLVEHLGLGEIPVVEH